MHVLFVGMTLSGKTSLAKKMVQKYKAAGIKTLVLDPNDDPDWNADFQTNDNAEFLNAYWQSRQCAVFVDESGDAIGRYDPIMRKIATKGRHLGHKAHFLTQRGSMLDRTIRDQCSTLFLFRVGAMDSKTFAEEFGYDELRSANILERGECFYVGRFGAPQKINVFQD